MTRHRWGRCAALLLLVGLVGCPAADLLDDNNKNPKTLGPTEDHFVNGSIEVVAQRTEGALTQLGVTLVAEPAGEELRWHCTSKTGKKFDLVLARSGINGGAYTDLRMEWREGVDDELAGRLLASLEVLISR